MEKLKKSCSFLYEQFYHYLLYIIKHPVCSLVILAGVLISYKDYAFATDYYVDSEVVINIPGTNYNWLEIGRYGLVLTRKLLGTGWYNPYYTGILMLLFLWLTGISFSYLAGKLFPRLDTSLSTLGSLIFITYPTFTEQYYFHFQSAEIAFGLWISILAMLLFYQFVKEQHLLCFILSLPIYILTFAIYQSFIPLALCGYLAIFLAIVLQTDTELSTIKRSIFGSILHFVIAFAISQGINKLCFPASGYLNNQVIWTSGTSLVESFKGVVTACLRMLTGQGLFYTAILLIAVVSAFASFFYFHGMEAYKIILGILSVIGIAITPFILTLLMGHNTAVRSQFTYSLAAIFLLLFAAQTVFDKKPTFKYGKLLAAIILLAFTVTQISTVRFIWKAHEYVADYDRETATDVMKIMYDSFTVDTGVAGIMFWGYLQPESPYDDELVGSPSYLFTSVFNLEHNMEPYCFFSTNRILGYMESMGHRFTYPNGRTWTISSFIMKHRNPSVFPDASCAFNDLEAFTLNLGNCPEYYY